MIQIEAYSLDFDKNDKLPGMSGKVFLNDYSESVCKGTEFKSIAEALQSISPKKLDKLEILYLYRDGEEQKFIKFSKSKLPKAN